VQGNRPAPSYGQTTSYNASYNAPPAPAPAAAPQPPSPDEFLSNPAEATRKQIEYLRATEFAPAMAANQHTTAQMARGMAEMRDPDAFKRFGPEIDLELRRFGMETWTPDNVKIVVDMVKGRHVHEISEELVTKRAEEKLKQMLGPNATLRSDSLGGTSAAVTNTLDFEKLPPNYSTVLKRLGVTPEHLDEFLTKTQVNALGVPLHKAREAWFKQAESGDIITDGREIIEVHG